MIKGRLLLGEAELADLNRFCRKYARKHSFVYTEVAGLISIVGQRCYMGVARVGGSSGSDEPPICGLLKI